jgi:hypothetical protein
MEIEYDPAKAEANISRLSDDKYTVIFSKECREQKDFEKVNIPPFEETEIDLSYVFGNMT